MGKKDYLSDIKSGRFLVTEADLLQFSQSTVSRVYGEWSEKEKIEWSEKEWQLCGQKWVSLMPEVRGE